MATAALFQADPRVANIARQIRAQQQIVAPRGIVVPDQYIDEMAQGFVRQFRTGDARQIDATLVEVERQVGEGEVQLNPVYVFHPKGQQLAPDGSNALDQTPAVGPSGPASQDFFAVSSDGRFDLGFVWNPALGVPVFIATKHQEVTFWGGFAQWVAVVAAMTGLPPMIGEAVLGAETAAAYPVVSNAVGKAAMQLALTGGDIEKSLTGAVASVAGAEVGDFVGSAVDSAAIGAVTQAATAAAIQGKDAGKAAIRAGLFAAAGGKMDDESEVTLEELGIDPAEAVRLLDQETQALESIGFTGAELFATPDGSLVTTGGQIAAASQTEWANGYRTDVSGNVVDIANRVVIPADRAASMSDGEIADYIFNDWMTQQATVVDTQPGDAARPASIPQTTPKTKVPTITDQAKVADALFKSAASISQSIRTIATGKPLPYQTNPYGTIRPQVPGVPITRPDGSTVVNNGNGTQTIRYPDGRVQTTSTAYMGPGYGSLVPGVSNQALLIGGAILIGAVLLARRK